MALSRRGLLTGLGAIIAAPAIVHAVNLMPIRGIVMDVPRVIRIPLGSDFIRVHNDSDAPLAVAIGNSGTLYIPAHATEYFGPRHSVVIGKGPPKTFLGSRLVADCADLGGYELIA